MPQVIEQHFPKLVASGYVVTSPKDTRYNCIAFTFGDQERWWWPPVYGHHLSSYWPSEAPPHETIAAFSELYGRAGFQPCESAAPEPGWIKVALLADASEGLLAHAALQHPNGRWISKMGDQEDIVHPLEALEGPPHHLQRAAILRCELDKISEKVRNLLLRYGDY